MYDRWFTIALLPLEFGQVWAKHGITKSHTTSGEILQTKDQLMMGNAGITKIAYNLRSIA